MNLEKQITEKLLTKLDQATVIDYVANNYSCEIIDILQDDIYDMVREQSDSFNDPDSAWNDRDWPTWMILLMLEYITANQKSIQANQS